MLYYIKVKDVNIRFEYNSLQSFLTSFSEMIKAGSTLLEVEDAMDEHGENRGEYGVVVDT